MSALLLLWSPGVSGCIICITSHDELVTLCFRFYSPFLFNTRTKPCLVMFDNDNTVFVMCLTAVLNKDCCVCLTSLIQLNRVTLSTWVVLNHLKQSMERRMRMCVRVCALVCVCVCALVNGVDQYLYIKKGNKNRLTGRDSHIISCSLIICSI